MIAHRTKQRGIALAYVAVFIFVLALMVGLAVDLGRAYAVRLELAKAVDAAALAAARVVPNGTTAAQAEAEQIFTLNFPAGHLGVDSVSTPNVVFATVPSGPNVGARLITVSAEANLPTTFMAMAGNQSIDIPASGQATRRLVDISFVIDHSGSLGADYPAVRTAANQFVDFFDAVNDRMALIMFSTDVVIADSMNVGGRGFNRANIKGHITNSASDGNTATAEGLYRGWDELRRVPSDIQSGLRVIVLFTDGAPNTISATFRRRQFETGGGDYSFTQYGAMKTGDFPDVGGSTGNNPVTIGLRDPVNPLAAGTLFNEEGCITPGGCWEAENDGDGPLFNQTDAEIPNMPHIPTNSTHNGGLSTGIPSFFPFQNTGLSGQRTLLIEASTQTTVPGHIWPNHPNNVSKAARNLAETIANAIRSDNSGAHPIHIYALGLGALLNVSTGVQPAETGSNILRRIANDPASGSYNATQPEGKYYFAGSATELNDAFQQIRDQIIRISE